ncbi:LacI family DNA-binding transcriptional regulator [Pararhizobium sp. YC-54]|uniref:LacI family DNA-binding transcriptional regulator n=1 Tax=Pararhizobium sp. YC-54 TaxID=2986920 RepID=UPI0021F6A867|nr:LacI family DNA-binding transcriptional regulator [Pararhizobium sp. YC-54]MCV9996870.1 LacI family DNA-binding transcriptional regulator [Pararhizobium sp. YC-54]
MRKKITKRKITLLDVAKAADVSAITVSRALRHPASVSAKLRERIQHVVDDLGYVPDPAASALASARTNVVGVLIPSITNNVFAGVLRGIYMEAEKAGYGIQLGNTRYSMLEEERLLRVFLSQRPAGLIVTGIDQSSAARTQLLRADCPVVQIMEIGDKPIDMMVGFSHRDGASTATQHLVDCGYTRIAFLGARMDPRTQRRLEGFSQCLKQAGLFDQRLVVTTPKASTVTLGCELLSELLARAPDADAVFCNNDDLALGVLFECQRRQITVPTDMGICGFNDLEMMAVANPAITSVRTFREEMGREAMGSLLASIAGTVVEQPVIDLGYELIKRQSTRSVK